MDTQAVIIDDEIGARESLKNILAKYCEGIHVAATADSVENGVNVIREHKPNLVFLDIEMPFGNAFELLKKIEPIDFDIIFITAYDNYAIKAIKYSALDYLLKPIDIDDLKSAVEKHKTKRQHAIGKNQLSLLLQNINETASPGRIAIPDPEGLLFVNIDEILRCESDGNYTKIFLASGKKHITAKTLGEYEELLPAQQFFRLHRSHIVNLRMIKKYIKGEGGYIIMQDESQVEVSRRKKVEFLKKLGQA